MERHELHNKIVQQLRFHRISGLDEEKCANNILLIVQEDWTEGCSCYHGDTTGETWCCNTCGKPTSKHTTSLPSDEEIYKLGMNDDTIETDEEVKGYEIGMKQMRSIASARIAEVERELQEAKQLVRNITEFADGMKVLDGEALEILKKTARRVLSDTPTKLPRRQTHHPMKGYLLLTKLNKYQRQKFIDNCRDYGGPEHLNELMESEYESFQEILMEAFIWHNSPERSAYWINIHDTIK